MASLGASSQAGPAGAPATGLPVRLSYEDAIDRRQCPRNAMDAAGAKHESCERHFNRGNRGSTLHRRGCRWVLSAASRSDRYHRPSPLAGTDAGILGLHALALLRKGKIPDPLFAHNRVHVRSSIRPCCGFCWLHKSRSLAASL
jgi:hypothetical protein